MHSMMDVVTSWDSPRANTTRRMFGSGRIPPSPNTPHTPSKPVWQQRCEEASTRCPYPTAYALKQSMKGEDRLIMDVRLGSGDSLWAVFDGHRSHDVAGHAARIVPGLVWSSPYWPSQPGEALRCAIGECHESARREELRGGCTAVVVACTGGVIWCCSAGDSRAVAGCRGGGARRLSVEHIARQPSEIERIQSMGGTVEWGCVGGTLPMTRGIGNFDLEADGFACLPDVLCARRQDVEFVVIASDGLWDVLGDEECVAMVRRFGPGSGAADLLIAEALARGSTDDIAVVVPWFIQPQVPRRVFGNEDAMEISPAPRMQHQPTLVSIPSSEMFNSPSGGFWRPPVVRELPFSDGY